VTAPRVTYRTVPPHGRTVEFGGSFYVQRAMERLAVPGMKHPHRRMTWTCPVRYAEAVIAELENRHGADIHAVLW
jgi:hypothetical protein